MNEEESIVKNLARVRERIAAAARRAGRAPDEVTLVAVSKTHPVHKVEDAYRAGVRDFGENRVREANAKIPSFRERVDSGELVRWHMIGHLQRRKARSAVVLFDMIHSVDSLRLAERINRMAEAYEKTVPVLLEVNVSGEASKHGYELASSDGAGGHEVFVSEVEQMLALPFLRVQGLMTMAPVVAHPDQARPFFVAVRELRDDLARRFPSAGWHHLSMGMTDDFEPAIEEGATIVRIGRAIFGERKL
jgi:pyridoxal phosphate enzyme (YggS family)